MSDSVSGAAATATPSLDDPSTWKPDLPAETIFAEKGWLQGAILGSVAYGGEVILFAMCCYLLVHQAQRDRTYLRKNAPLLVYISIIVLLGTLFMASLADYTQLAFIENRNYPGGPSAYENAMFSIPVDELGNVSFVSANWLCDALIVWRCMVIYKGCRFPIWVVMFFPCLLYLASFTMGLMWLLQISASSPFTQSQNWTIPYFTLSLSLNIILTIAIVIRLMIYRFRITSVLGRSHGSHYTSIAAMVVESAAIFSVFSLLFLIPFAIGSTSASTTKASSFSQIFLQSMGQVQIIATLLIVFRVAQGKGWSSNMQTSLGTGTGLVIASGKSGSTGGAIRMSNFSHIQFQSQTSGATTAVNSEGQKSPGILISREVFTEDGSSVHDSKRDLRPDEVV